MSASSSSPDRRIELLTRNNFDTWSMQIEAILTKNDLWEYVDGSNKMPGDEGSERNAWLKQDKKAKADLILAISPSELYRVRGYETAQEVWSGLQHSYAYDAVNPPENKASLWQKKDETEEDNEICRRLLVGEGSIIKVFCHHPVKKTLIDKKLIGLEASWGEATDRAYKSMMLDDVDRDQVRLVTYQESTGLILTSFEGREEESLTSVLGRKPETLLLEIRNKDDVFESYPPGSLPKLVYLIDSTQNVVIRGPIVVRARLTQTVQEYKEQLVVALDMDTKDMFLIFQSQILLPRIMIADTSTLQEEGYASASKILVLSSLDSGKMIDLDHFLDIYSLIGRLLLINVSLPDLNEGANTDREPPDQSTDEDMPRICSLERDRDPTEIISKITPDEHQPDKLLRVLYDKKMGPSTLKKLLQPYVGVSAEKFMLWVIQSDPYKSSIGSDWTWDPNWYNLVDGNTIAVKLKSGCELNQEETELDRRHLNPVSLPSQESMLKFSRPNFDKNIPLMRS